MQKKRIFITAVVLLLTLLPLDVLAAETTGTIRCWLSYDNQPVSDCSLEIYRTGEPVAEGYRLEPEFGGGIIAGEDIPSDAFAQWMSEKAGPGSLQWAGRNGLVSFEGLEPGMYLIRQGEESRDFYPIDPYLACVSEELTQIDTYPKIKPRGGIPRTAQNTGVYLGTMGIALTISGLIYCLCEKKFRRL